MKNIFISVLVHFLTFFGVLIILSGCKDNINEKRKPNIVLIFLDDGGFGDFAPFGAPRYPTPHVSKLAEEGCSYYNFYVPQAVCSASRASLLTGCYPGRTRVFSALDFNEAGLDPEYATFGEVMQQNGYITGLFGKWHLGNQSGRRPHDRGFDESYGIMYSHDMWSLHPVRPEKFPPLTVWENGEIVIDSVTSVEQKMLSTWFTEKSVDFINRHKNEPFFLYLPHPQPHVPLFVSNKFAGKSGTGLYGDVIMELDWSVGQIMQAIKNNDLEESTIFIFINSDNGPTFTYHGNHSGITPFRAGKSTSFDGGLHNACIIKYPGGIEPNTVSHQTFCSIDLLPSICHATGTALPENDIDGKNIWDLIVGKPDAKNPHDFYAFSTSRNLEGVITSDGQWKLFMPHKYVNLIESGKDGLPGVYGWSEMDTTLFDLLHDPYEKGDVKNSFPEITDKLVSYYNKHKDYFYSSDLKE